MIICPVIALTLQLSACCYRIPMVYMGQRLKTIYLFISYFLCCMFSSTNNLWLIYFSCCSNNGGKTTRHIRGKFVSFFCFLPVLL